jgi:hypothetical protein
MDKVLFQIGSLLSGFEKRGIFEIQLNDQVNKYCREIAIRPANINMKLFRTPFIPTNLRS